jgi:hypothetical protein
LQYCAPAPGSRALSTQDPARFSSTETMSQSVPFDLQYTVSILSEGRGAPGARAQAETMLAHVLRIYPPYGAVYVKDSLGDQRTYSCFMDAVGMMDEVADVSDRTIGFAVTLRVEAEYDLADPVTHAVALNRKLRTSLK